MNPDDPRSPLLEQLRHHVAADATEEGHRVAVAEFVAATPDCFLRSHLAGHVTGSAWITSPDGRLVLLLLHRKLGAWLQPGGHADGDPDIRAVARREAEEETGLRRFVPASVEAKPLDVDVHLIPARPGVPAHFHYDVRYHFIADPAEPLLISDESLKLAWHPLDAIETLTAEESILRMRRKTAR